MSSNYKAPYPHCDSNVLHFPKFCVYCDQYPEKQAERIDKGINFTGQQDPNKAPCPAETNRPLDTINHWYGNVPVDDSK